MNIVSAKDVIKRQKVQKIEHERICNEYLKRRNRAIRESGKELMEKIHKLMEGK